MTCWAITGASGFVGGALLDGLAGGPGLRLLSLGRAAPGGGTGRHAAIGDLMDPGYGSALPDGIDILIHCAARVHQMKSPAADPDGYLRANTDATLSLARAAAAKGVRRMIFLSSIKVNGEGTDGRRPFCASDSAAPRDPYGVSKHLAEVGLREIARQTGLDVVIVRPPMVYGRAAGGNFAALAKSIAFGAVLPLGGLTRNRRSLIGIGNLVDVINHCAICDAARGRTFLVSDGEDLSTAELARRMAAAMDRPARLAWLPPGVIEGAAALVGRRAVARRLCGSLQVDIAETRAALSWSPPFSVDAELRSALQLDVVQMRNCDA